MKYDYAIGIDPGKKTGFAVKDLSSNSFVEVETLLIHQAIDRLYRYAEEASVIVYVEDARQRKWYNDARKSAKAARGLAMGAASVKRDCTIWEDVLKDLGVSYVLVAPKNNRTKLDANLFAKATKWDKRTSDHSRDAAMLIHSVSQQRASIDGRKNK